MSKLFKGNVSITTGYTKTGTEDIRLTKDVDGAYNSENAKELLAKALECSKKEKLELNTWSFYFPLGTAKELEPVLLADKFGKPKLTMLPPQKEKQTNTRKSRKLA